MCYIINNNMARKNRTSRRSARSTRRSVARRGARSARRSVARRGKRSARRSVARRGKRSSSRSAGRKKSSNWISHVQAFYKEQKSRNPNYKYKQAMKDARSTFKR